MLTAAAVFIVGMVVLPSVAPEPEPAPVAPPPPPEPPPPPPPPPPAAAAPDAASADAKASDAAPLASAEKAAKPGPASAPPGAEPAAAPPRPQPAAVPPRPEAAAPPAKTEAAAPRDKSADKDVAREAWRKNLPDITAEGGKAAILIPIKGSVEGAVFHVSAKPRFVVVTLPKAESMITMPFYSIKRDGFRQLWLSKDKDSGATTIKVNLGDASEPQVEIKDEFVRVTVRRAGDAAAQGGVPSPPPDKAAPAPAPEKATPPAPEKAAPAPAPARD